MKKLLLLMPVLLLLSACGTDNMAKARSLREEILTEKECAFSIAVTADYGREQYDFSMDCTWKQGEGLAFTVTAPETIAGITGTVAAAGGTLTFDDKVLAYGDMADEQLSPVQAPYVLMHTLTEGYFRTCTVGDGKYCLDADVTYEEKSIGMQLWISQDNLPQSGGLFREDTQILGFTVENFRFL